MNVAEADALDAFTDAVGDLVRVLFRCAGQYGNEFFAAGSSDHFTPSQCRLQCIADPLQYDVTRRVAEGVVDPLEMIGVERQDAESGSGSAGGFELLVRDVQKVAPVREPGQLIRHCGYAKAARLLDLAINEQH